MGHATGSRTRTASVSAVAGLLALAALSACATCRRPCPSPAESFLVGWAVAVGDDVDAAIGCPKRIRRTADGMVMVLIPAGTFPLGAVPEDSDAADEEMPRRTVTIAKPYYLDEHEVTVAMWRKYASATGAEVPHLEYDSDGGMPMHNLSLTDARGYLAWARARLPTEAEWERAARGGHDDYVFPWGFADDPTKRNAAGKEDGFEGLAPVKSYAPNDYGLFDMSGNVSEFTADAFPDREQLVAMRGGCYLFPGVGTKASFRYGEFPEGRFDNNGLRCAASIP